MAVSLIASTVPERRDVEPEPARVVWVDPVQLARFAVHDAGASGRPYPELERDGAERRAQLNAEIVRGLAARSWDVNAPAVLHVDRSTGLARLRDGNHRVRFAVVAGLARVPVRIEPARVRARGTTIAHQYRGDFDRSPVAFVASVC